MFKKIIKFSGLLCLIFVLVVLLNVNFNQISGLPEGFVASYEDIKSVNENGAFGKFVKVGLNEISAGASKENKSIITFKLFGVFPIRKIEVVVAPDDDMYIGGVPIGFNIKTKGAIVIGENPVETDEGKIKPEQSSAVKVGDVLVKVNEVVFEDLSEISQIVEASEGREVSLTLNRKGKEVTSMVKPLLDKGSGKYKLGLWVRDDASGVGTLTYVNKNTSDFGALGHQITDFETGAPVIVDGGEIYECSVLGINKGERGNPGELKCLFLQGKNQKGEIEKNTNYGVFGKVTDRAGLIDENLTAKIGGRMSVKPGKAKIVSNVSGVREEYDIEIIKANYQTKSGEKSIVFRVTDERLLNLTGGIIQGMSGSPILQDGKIVGAVTHVFLTDPTKGYGVYVDWML